MILTLNQIEL